MNSFVCSLASGEAHRRALICDILLCCVGIFCSSVLQAQDLPLTQAMTMSTLSPLDLSKGVGKPDLESARHSPVPEEYIWTADDTARDAKIVYTFPAVTEQIEPHYFREHFNLGTLPKEATLYLAGPRSVKVWINGQMAEQVESDVTSPLGMHVFATDVTRFLKAGTNVIAVEAVRGRGVTGFANSALLRQQTFGQVLVAKMIAKPMWVDWPSFMRSGKDWKSSAATTKGWESAGFDDTVWSQCRVSAGSRVRWSCSSGTQTRDSTTGRATRASLDISRT